MAQTKNKQKERQYGKPTEQKKHPISQGRDPLLRRITINPKFKNSIWTIIVIIILLIFFIINNTRTTPAQGPYPPNYDQKAAQERLQK